MSSVASQKILLKATIGLVGIELGLALTYAILIFSQGSVAPFWDFNGLRSLPSLLQAAHLFAIGCLSLSLLFLKHRMPRSISWLLPVALTLLCFYGGIDEITKLHLHFKQYNWQLIYISLLAAIPILGWRDLTLV